VPRAPRPRISRFVRRFGRGCVTGDAVSAGSLCVARVARVARGEGTRQGRQYGPMPLFKRHVPEPLRHIEQSIAQPDATSAPTAASYAAVSALAWSCTYDVHPHSSSIEPPHCPEAPSVHAFADALASSTSITSAVQSADPPPAPGGPLAALEPPMSPLAALVPPKPPLAALAPPPPPPPAPAGAGPPTSQS
jgi:hypothetical protein